MVQPKLCYELDMMPTFCRATLKSILDDGMLAVQDADGSEFACDWLDTGVKPVLEAGAMLLVLRPGAMKRGVVLGRIGAFAPSMRVTLEATESLTLKCGEASVELRADGRAMVKGEDVLLRAKGTQRIRAGNVAIN